MTESDKYNLTSAIYKYQNYNLNESDFLRQLDKYDVENLIKENIEKIMIGEPIKSEEAELLNLISNDNAELISISNTTFDETVYQNIMSYIYGNEHIHEIINSLEIKDKLKMITNDVYVPHPLNITQDEFDELVDYTIKVNSEETPENLWRLSMIYNSTPNSPGLYLRGEEKIKATSTNIPKDLYKIINHFLEDNDDYYLSEIMSTIDIIDHEYIFDKLIKSNNKELISKILNKSFLNEIITQEIRDILESIVK